MELLLVVFVFYCWFNRVFVLSYAYSITRRIVLRFFLASKYPTRDPFAAAIEEAILNYTNAYRSNKNLPELSRNKRLDDSSDYHAKRMNYTREFEHTLSDGVDLSSRVQAAGYVFQSVRENLAFVSDFFGATPNSLGRDFVDMWIDSDGHRKNLEADDVVEIGIAVLASGGRIYAVQNFGKPMFSAPVIFPKRTSSQTKVKRSSVGKGRLI